MPEPMRTSTQPSTSSAISASRTDGRLTPSWRARSRSAGSRLPAANSPAVISAAQLLGDLAVQALRFDGLQGHGDGRKGPPNGQVVRPINITATIVAAASGCP